MSGLAESKEHEDSEFLYHTNCDDCGSSDAKSVYSDGHTYCFSCTTHHSGGSEPPRELKPVPKGQATDFPRGEPVALPKRKLSEATTKRWQYEVGTY
jgi:twinkle protein